MADSLIQPGAELDGFAVGQCVHQGGMNKLPSFSMIVGVIDDSGRFPG